MNKKKQTIIYIMSDVRSGSTLLENILSNAPNTLSVGELHHLDSHLYKEKWGKTWNWNCSCGKSIDNCGFWKKILANLGQKNIKVNNTSIKPKTRDKEKNKIIEQYNAAVIKHIDDIYTAIFEETGVNVIIDSSKHTEHGFLLYNNSNYNIRFIYLKRDIRAVTISKAKWAKKFKQKEKSFYHIIRRTKIRDNELKKVLKSIPAEHFVSIKYEELANNPQLIINKINKKLGLHYFDVPEYMDLTKNHTIGGTPNRFEKSPIELDRKWETISKKKPVFHIVGKIIDLF